jgi:hypothetical protein
LGKIVTSRPLQNLPAYEKRSSVKARRRMSRASRNISRDCPGEMPYPANSPGW